MAEFTYNGKEFIDYLKDLDAVRQFIVAQDIELAARAARADKLEKALRKAQDRIYYAVDWRREGKDEPLKQAWREIEEALGDAAPSSEGGEDGN